MTKEIENELNAVIKDHRDAVKPYHYEHDYQYSGEIASIDFFIRLGHKLGYNAAVNLCASEVFNSQDQDEARDSILKLLIK